MSKKDLHIKDVSESTYNKVLFKQFLDFLEGERIVGICNVSHEALTFPFDLIAEDFMQFAKEDLTEHSEKSLVNALSNIKRAIDCRIACVLVYFGIYNSAKKNHWSFPKSAKFLMDIGVIAPDFLNKINTKRNKLEHEFKKPTISDVKDYFGIANLFMGYTDQFLRNFNDFEIHDASIIEDIPNAQIDLFSQKSLIVVTYCTGFEDIRFEIKFNEKEEIYNKLLSFLVKSIIKR